jgi:hypothetical protein
VIPPLLFALERLERALESIHYTGVALFQPGLPQEEIVERLGDIGVPPHPDIVTLYSWHNGGFEWRDGKRYSMHLTFAWLFVPFEDALNSYVTWFSDDPVEYQTILPGHWFPTLKSTGGEWIVLDSAAPTECDAPVAVYIAELFPEETNVHHALHSAVTWWAEYYESGVWGWDAERQILTDGIHRDGLPGVRSRSRLV